MADLSITISNSLNLFGPAPSSKWNAWNWNAFKWGEGTHDLTVSALKVLSNSLSPSDSLTKSAMHVVSETLSPTADMGSEALSDSAGYSYVFPDRTTEGEERDFPTWTAGSTTSVTWSTATVTTTTWS